MKYAIIGYGNRGEIYSGYFAEDKRVKLVAVCDKNPVRLKVAKEKRALKDEQLYSSDKEFFAKGKIADLLVVSTQDKDHYENAMQALETGYDLLLEKPIADSLEKCLAIQNLAKKLGRHIFVCHVLRYAPFFGYIKEQLASGKYGKVVTVNLTENVGYYHQAHSYIRGSWAITEKSTPMIVAKCCHDLDILSWLMEGSKCETVSSFGNLSYFNADNAPAGSADYCFECAIRHDCPYDAISYYRDNAGGLFLNNWYYGDLNDKKAVEKALENKECPYAKCVYHSDNTAVDHQVVNLLFDNGCSAHLTMTAFSADIYREIHVHCSLGEIFGNMHDNLITCNVFGKSHEVFDVGKVSDRGYMHGGGDSRMIRDVIAYYEDENAKELTSIENSFISHILAYAAEESRLKGGVPVKIQRK